MLSQRPRELAMRVVPWLALALALIFLLTRYSAAEIAREMSAGNAGAMMLPLVAMVLSSLFIQSAADWVVFRRTTRQPPSYWIIARGRAALSVFAMIGYVLSGAALGVWLARKTRTPVSETLGILAFVLVTDVVAVATVAAAAVHLGGAEHFAPELRLGLELGAAVLALGSVLAVLVVKWVLRDRFAELGVVRAAREMPMSAFFATSFGRALHLSNIGFWTLIAARGFGLELPASVFWTVFPVILLVTALPVNVFGLGAAQVVWLVFEPWAPGERILAFQFLWTVFGISMVVLRGLPFVRVVMAEITAKPAE